MESALVHNQSFSGAPRSAAHTSIEKCCPRTVAHTSLQKRCPQSVAHASSHPESLTEKGEPRFRKRISRIQFQAVVAPTTPPTTYATTASCAVPNVDIKRWLLQPPPPTIYATTAPCAVPNVDKGLSISSGGCSNHSCEKSQPQREDHANREDSISGAETPRKEPPGFNSESEVISHPGLGIPSHPSLGIPE